MKTGLIKLIKLYQKTLSPDHGLMRIFHPYGYCRFHPTCSQYCIDSLRKYNIFKAFYKCVWRLVRCNPFSRGGLDEA